MSSRARNPHGQAAKRLKHKDLIEEGRNAWITAGLDFLASGGIDDINVESLGRSLGLSKGSFYWHFTDRRELLAAIRDAWHRREESRFGPDSDAAKGTAERLARFHSLGNEPGQAHLELAMNAWARSDLEAAGDVAEIERLRMNYLERILLDMGFSVGRAAWWAAALYQAFLGLLENSARLPQIREEKEQIADRFSSLILAAATLEDYRREMPAHELPGGSRSARRKP